MSVGTKGGHPQGFYFLSGSFVLLLVMIKCKMMIGQPFKEARKGF